MAFHSLAKERWNQVGSNSMRNTNIGLKEPELYLNTLCLSNLRRGRTNKLLFFWERLCLQHKTMWQICQNYLPRRSFLALMMGTCSWVFRRWSRPWWGNRRHPRPVSGRGRSPETSCCCCASGTSCATRPSWSSSPSQAQRGSRACPGVIDTIRIYIIFWWIFKRW